MSLCYGKNLILHPYTRERLDLVISTTQSTIISRWCTLLSRSQQRHNLIRPSRLGLRRWGLCLLAGDFVYYTKPLSWFLCSIASFFYQFASTKETKEKNLQRMHATPLRLTSMCINLPTIPCFKIQLQIYDLSWQNECTQRTNFMLVPGGEIYVTTRKTKKQKKALVWTRVLHSTVQCTVPSCPNIVCRKSCGQNNLFLSDLQGQCPVIKTVPTPPLNGHLGTEAEPPKSDGPCRHFSRG